MGKVTGVWVGVLVVFAMTAGGASAGLLDTGMAYNDGAYTWKGTAPFVGFSNANLNGSVEWVVYAPGQFPFDELPFSGYTPTPGQYTYVYQVIGTGSDPISSYTVPLENPANNIGYFTQTDATWVAPIGMNLESPGVAEWDFPGIGAGSNSVGLVYSSPNSPQDSWSVVINGGDPGVAEPVCAPSPDSIPEPSTVMLLIAGLSISGFVWCKSRCR